MPDDLGFLYWRWLLELWHGRFEVAIGPIAQGSLAARWSGIGRGAEKTMRFLGHDLLRYEAGRFAEYWVVSRIDS